MAKKNKDEDPEEDNNQFDDEDFGLPDLDYEELDEAEDELDDEFKDFDESVESDEFDEPLEEEFESSEPEESDSFDDGLQEEETSAPEESPEDSENWEEELHNELDDDLKPEGNLGESDDLFYEEESYDEFEDNAGYSEDSGFESESQDSGYGESTEHTDDLAASSAYAEDQGDDSGGYDSGASDYQYSYDSGSDAKGRFARFVVIGTLLFAVIAIVFWLVSGSGGSDKPKKKVAKVEKADKPATDSTAKGDTVKAKVVPPKPEDKPEEREPKSVAQPNDSGSPGQVTVLRQRTGKSYVIVGSFFDDDFANDFAKTLAAKGQSPMIIPPFKHYRFYRVAIAEFNTFYDAKSNVPNFRGEYGSDVWPLRY